MKEYSSTKEYDAVSMKNLGESEVRNEVINSIHDNSENLNAKSIHNKRKLSR